ncbi:PREDICTED: uricase-like [Bactrocera latifrons]|uniref:uricase-like n=1 Tax=Bactrocera latifrons TaxID=174628 RepID=UPI0008DE4919|nr:PREDICTED: uricase-like [Bactrocera latifrons]
MFTRQLHNADPSKVSKIPDPRAPNYRMGDYGYGKQGVRVFQLKKDGPVHSVTEFKVNSHMRLRTHKEYYQDSKVVDIDFKTHWLKVRDLILQSFAGDPEKGVVITSVQYAAYVAERAVLDAIPEICSISISLPNYKHFPFDFSRFPPIEPKANVIIANPADTPLGLGYAQLDRLEK